MTDGMVDYIVGLMVGFISGMIYIMYVYNHHLSLPKAENILQRAKSRAAAKAAYKHEMEKDQ